MKIFSSLFLLALVSTVFICCQKDSDPTPATTTNTDYLTASAWVYESAGIDQNKDGTIDASFPPGTVQDCQLDNVLTFKKDGSATSDAGATKCNASDPQTTQFNWSFADNDKSLVISNNVFTSLNGKLKVLTLDKTKLSLSKDTTIFSIPLAIVVNMKH